MAFTLPQFNLTMSVWSGFPATGAPVATYPCALYTHPKPYNDITPGDPLAWAPAIYLRVPKEFVFDLGFPIIGVAIGLQDQFTNWWYYRIRWWERVHADFPNEYAQWLVEQCDVNGTTPDPNR